MNPSVSILARLAGLPASGIYLSPFLNSDLKAHVTTSGFDRVAGDSGSVTHACTDSGATH